MLVVFGDAEDNYGGDEDEGEYHVVGGGSCGDSDRGIGTEVAGGGDGGLEIGEDGCEVEHVRCGCVMFGLWIGVIDREVQVG